MAFITVAGENWFAAHQVAGTHPNIERFVLAYIEGLGAEPADRIESMPAPAAIVLERAWDRRGSAGPNQVVYSMLLDATIGDFVFNWVGLAGADDVLVAASHIAPITKTATDGDVRGNNLTRNFALAFSGIAALLDLDVPADAWQMDFTWAALAGKPDTFPPDPHNHDDRYYTVEEVDAELAGKSNTGHNHDDRYYTEAEVDTALAGKSDTGHNHDDRYYTEAEVDAELAGKSNTGHNHDDRYYTEAEVDTALAGKSDTGHNHDDRYYTEAEVDTALAGKSNTGHNHDDRYYTEAEVDTALAGKSDTGHNHDDRYYTKTQLQTSGQASAHWDNVGTGRRNAITHLGSDLRDTMPFSGDMDALVTPGDYYYNSDCTHAPSDYGLVKVWREVAGVVYQQAQESHGGRLYSRYLTGGVWTAWRTYADSADVVPRAADLRVGSIALGAIYGLSAGYAPGTVLDSSGDHRFILWNINGDNNWATPTGTWVSLGCIDGAGSGQLAIRTA
ncbi:Phage tail-collar fibre protein [Methylomagnum ishizawai]|uniref:Phage tail-collar fibre protein n=1 Tax=Methylomagnum ishizawai TaxID=1760988 RepID=A0A1Y6CW25_9GAMM|nr:phage tail protein [Methylomagnum ishizawai]SMF94440.1 Phage tail-collar fibre protein [Methylomagnum ishizawai]